MYITIIICLQSIPAVQVLVIETSSAAWASLNQLLQVVLRLLGTTAGLLVSLLLRVVLGLPSLQHNNLVFLNTRSNNFFITFLHPWGELGCTLYEPPLSRTRNLPLRFPPLYTQLLTVVSSNPSWCRLRSIWIERLVETLPCRT